jgi:hypothetical protein
MRVEINVWLCNVECAVRAGAACWRPCFWLQTVVVCVRGWWLHWRAPTRLSTAGPLEIDRSLRPLVPVARLVGPMFYINTKHSSSRSSDIPRHSLTGALRKLIHVSRSLALCA